MLKWLIHRKLRGFEGTARGARAGVRIMASQMYPTLKYALGHGQACTRVTVAGRAVTPARMAAQAA